MKKLVALAAVAAMPWAAGAQAQSEVETCWRSFAMADVDNDGYVRPDEAAVNVETVFEQIDANADGLLTRQEYRNCLVQVPGASAGLRDRATSQERFAALDGDGDGRITLDEYVTSGEQAFRSVAGQDRRAPIERYRESVAEKSSGPADFNRDRFIEESEAATDITRTFAFLDADRDGAVSRSEWTATVERARSMPSFGAMDQNGDGRLSLVELKSGAPWTELGASPVPIWRYSAQWLLMRQEPVQATRSGDPAAKGNPRAD